MPKLGQSTKPPAVRDRIAINLADLDRLSPFMRQAALGGKLGTVPIRTDPGRPDETAVEFVCDPLVAASICDVLRSHDRKAGDVPTRVYLCRAEAWRRVPATMMLAVIENGQPALNPAAFRLEWEAVAPIRPRFKPVSF